MAVFYADDDQLDLNYHDGVMVINLGAFFPTNKANIKKLYKIIDGFYYDEKTLKAKKDKITDYLMNEIGHTLPVLLAEAHTKRDNFYREWVRLKCERVECERRVKERKHSNGLPMTKDELEHEKSELTRLKAGEMVYLKDFNKAKVEAVSIEKRDAKLRENLKYIGGDDCERFLQGLCKDQK